MKKLLLMFLFILVMFFAYSATATYDVTQNNYEGYYQVHVYNAGDTYITKIQIILTEQNCCVGPGKYLYYVNVAPGQDWYSDPIYVLDRRYASWCRAVVNVNND